MASVASTLSWSSSSWLQSFAGNINEATKLSDRRTRLVVVTQKKAKKARMAGNLAGRHPWLEHTAPRRVGTLIILKEDITDLGKKGQLLSVKAGYYRNYLLPLGKAQIVTPLLLKEMKVEEERIEAEKIRVKEEAEQLARIFETVGGFKVKRKGGKGKLIFGREVDKRIVSLPDIREIGEYIAELKLHPEVTAKVRVIVSAN